jgi:hypothetical protein
MNKILLSLPAFLLLAACGKTISADSYNQSCKFDEDCRSVRTGDVCGCSCEEGSINKEQVTTYESDVFSIKKDCADDVKACKPCAAAKLSYCNSGTCSLR